jgi:hypothetical protein
MSAPYSATDSNRTSGIVRWPSVRIPSAPPGSPQKPTCSASGEAAVLVETGESFRELTARRAEDASRSESLEAEPCAQNDEGHHHLAFGRARE